MFYGHQQLFILLLIRLKASKLFVAALKFLKFFLVNFSEIKSHCKKNLENRETETGETMDTS